MIDKVKTVLAFFGLALIFVLFQSNAGGRPGTYAGAPGDSGTCGSCHTSTGAGSISLTGAPSQYTAGATYNMDLTLINGTALVGGFQIVATDGTTNTLIGSFSPGAGQTLNNVSRLVQSTPKNFAGGSVSWPISWTAPSTGAPSKLQFFYSGNAANGNGGNGSGDFTYSGMSSLIVLPVELLDFSAQYKNGQVDLNWQTGAEINSSHFAIERSEDGRQFKEIASVQAKGIEAANTYTSYTFKDEEAHSGLRYYRLKIIDLDGQFEFSSIESVIVKNEISDELTIYPNPLQQGELLNVDFTNDLKNANVKLSIFNSLGKEVYHQTIDSEEQMPLALNICQIKAGLHFVRISDGSGLISSKTLLLR